MLRVSSEKECWEGVPFRRETLGRLLVVMLKHRSSKDDDRAEWISSLQQTVDLNCDDGTIFTAPKVGLNPAFQTRFQSLHAVVCYMLRYVGSDATLIRFSTVRTSVEIAPVVEWTYPFLIKRPLTMMGWDQEERSAAFRVMRPDYIMTIDTSSRSQRLLKIVARIGDGRALFLDALTAFEPTLKQRSPCLSPRVSPNIRKMASRRFREDLRETAITLLLESEAVDERLFESLTFLSLSSPAELFQEAIAPALAELLYLNPEYLVLFLRCAAVRNDVHGCREVLQEFLDVVDLHEKRKKKKSGSCIEVIRSEPTLYHCEDRLIGALTPVVWRLAYENALAIAIIHYNVPFAHFLSNFQSSFILATRTGTSRSNIF